MKKLANLVFFILVVPVVLYILGWRWRRCPFSPRDKAWKDPLTGSYHVKRYAFYVSRQRVLTRTDTKFVPGYRGSYDGGNHE